MDGDKSPLQAIKHRFYAMRNGIVADTLRRAGAEYRVIFGVNLPQLKEIASDIGYDAGLARELWANVSTRESVLLAPMIMPAEEFTIDEARRWVASAPSVEAVDVPFAAQIADECLVSDSRLMQYAAMRLRSYIS